MNAAAPVADPAPSGDRPRCRRLEDAGDLQRDLARALAGVATTD
ncbi:hypothetical protein [Pengzhenrongella phosphoraccumulans]